LPPRGGLRGDLLRYWLTHTLRFPNRAEQVMVPPATKAEEEAVITVRATRTGIEPERLPHRQPLREVRTEPRRLSLTLVEVKRCRRSTTPSSSARGIMG
jgi:hypothetical protein